MWTEGPLSNRLGATSQTSHVPAGLVNSSQITPVTAPSNHLTFPLSHTITAQLSSSPLKPLEAHDANSAVERIDNRPGNVEEDARGSEDVALTSPEAFPTDFDRGYTISIAAPCHTPPYLPGGRELSLSLQGSLAQQSPPESPSLQQRTQSMTISASGVTPMDRPLQPPRSGAVSRREEDLASTSGWTRKRLRSQTGRGIEVSGRGDDNPVQAPSVLSSTGRTAKRKAAKTSRSSKTAQHIDVDPNHSMARRIGHSDRIGEMQQIIYQLQSGADQALTPVQTPSEAIIPSSLEGLVRLLHIIPTVAQRIKESAFCEQLSRIRNRLALAEFYSAYHVAQHQPDEFLRVVDQILPTAAAFNQTSKTKVKNRLIDLMFDQSGANRNRKKRLHSNK